MAEAPGTAVAFVIREKFSYSLASLQRLYALAGAPFTLYFVDGRYPAAIRAELERFLAGKDNVVRIEAGRFLYPAEALNLVVERAAEARILLLTNDVLIGRDALARLVASMDAASADVVVPAVLDLAEDGKPSLHRDDDHEHPVAFEERDGKIHAPPEAAARWKDGMRRIDYFEMHCLLARTEALRAAGPLPPMNVHEHVDLSIALWRAGRVSCLDDGVRVLYAGSPPLPLREFEHPYFRFRWDLQRAGQSDRLVRERWPIAELFDPTTHFIAHQHSALAGAPGYLPALATDTWPEDFATS